LIKSIPYLGVEIIILFLKIIDGWWNDWAEALFQAKEESLLKGQSIEKARSLEPVPMFIETAVVADVKFIKYYEEIDPEEYLLSVFNIVRTISIQWYHPAYLR
jgi:hypothetical protein